MYAMSMCIPYKFVNQVVMTYVHAFIVNLVINMHIKQLKNKSTKTIYFFYIDT